MSAPVAVAGDVDGSGVGHVEDQEVVGEIIPTGAIEPASDISVRSPPTTDPLPAVPSLPISTSTSPPTAPPLSSGTSIPGAAPTFPPLPEPPAYSNNPSPPSPLSSHSPSPPPPPLPPSPTFLRPLTAVRPASFPLITNLPSFTPRPYTFHAGASPPPHHSVAIEIFPEADTDPSLDEEPLPTYSRFPKRGESHCMGEVGDSADDDSGSDPGWEDGARRTCCCGSLYMRTLIAGVVLLVMACVITGGVVGWQMKANFENVPASETTPNDMSPGPPDVLPSVPVASPTSTTLVLGM